MVGCQQAQLVVKGVGARAGAGGYGDLAGGGVKADAACAGRGAGQGGLWDAGVLCGTGGDDSRDGGAVEVDGVVGCDGRGGGAAGRYAGVAVVDRVSYQRWADHDGVGHRGAVGRCVLVTQRVAKGVGAWRCAGGHCDGTGGGVQSHARGQDAWRDGGVATCAQGGGHAVDVVVSGDVGNRCGGHARWRCAAFGGGHDVRGEYYAVCACVVGRNGVVDSTGGGSNVDGAVGLGKTNRRRDGGVGRHSGRHVGEGDHAGGAVVDARA